MQLSISEMSKEKKTRQWITSLPYRQTISFSEAVYDMVRKIYGRPSDDPVKHLNVNVAIWRIVMNSTLEAAIHLGNDHDTNLRNVKN